MQSISWPGKSKLELNTIFNIVFRYKKEYLMFNDDIQGTAATVLAGLYGAMKVRGLEPSALKDQVKTVFKYFVFLKVVIFRQFWLLVPDLLAAVFF